MFLQVLPPENIAVRPSIFENLVFVVLGLTLFVFILLRVAKFLNNMKISKRQSKPSCSS